MYHYFDGFMGSFAWLGFIIMFLFWILVIWGLIFLARKTGDTADKEQKSPTKSALEILDDRYAMGEIKKEEYEEKKKDILNKKM